MKILILVLLQISLLNCYNIEPIYPLENKTINLNDTNKYIIYEFNNKIRDELGNIYIYFTNHNNNNNDKTSVLISVYYSINNISINEEAGDIINYDEQQIYTNNTFLKFNSKEGMMYFVISNFNQNFSAKMHLFNNYGYTDITDYEFFRLTFYFEPLDREYNHAREHITFSIQNDVKKKNIINYHIFNENSKTYGWLFAKTNITEKRLDTMYMQYEWATLEMGEFKNETILLELSIGYHYEEKPPLPYFDYYEILIFCTDYYYSLYPLYNNESSFLFIPSIKKQTYYLFIDTTDAYKSIYITAKGTNSNFGGIYYFFEENSMEEARKNIPPNDYIYTGYPISKSIIGENLYEIKINLPSQKKSVVLAINTIYNDIEFRLTFFKAIPAIPIENYTFYLTEEQRFIIYNYPTKENDFINVNFEKGNSENSSIYIYNEITDIKIDENDNIYRYKEGFDLNSNMYSFYSDNKHIYILISNFIND